MYMCGIITMKSLCIINVWKFKNKILKKFTKLDYENPQIYSQEVRKASSLPIPQANDWHLK
jgi:hypothetical protein